MSVCFVWGDDLPGRREVCRRVDGGRQLVREADVLFHRSRMSKEDEVVT